MMNRLMGEIQPVRRTSRLYRSALWVVPVLVALSATPAAADRLQDLEQQNRLLTKQVQQLLRTVHNNAKKIEQVKQTAAKSGKPGPRVTRSGKSAVELTLSGQVNRAMMFVDDGKATNTFHVDNDASSTRFRMVGKARLNEDISAGAVIELEAESDSSKGVHNLDSASTQDDDDRAFAVGERKLEVYLKSKTFGKLSLGQGSTASDGTAEQDLSGTSVISKSEVESMGGRMQFRNSATMLLGGGGLEIADAFANFDGNSREDRVRYDTPSFAGLSLAVSNATRDRTDVGLKFGGKTGGFKVKAAAGYSRTSDATAAAGPSASARHHRYSGSASVLHDSGFSLTVAGGTNIPRDLVAAPTPTPKYVYFKGGYQWTWKGVGKSAVAIDYYDGSDFIVDGSDSAAYGIFFVQKVDKIGTELYAGVRQFSYDQVLANFDDITVAMTGARIKF